jgi:hypothetical protein
MFTSTIYTSVSLRSQDRMQRMEDHLQFTKRSPHVQGPPRFEPCHTALSLNPLPEQLLIAKLSEFLSTNAPKSDHDGTTIVLGRKPHKIPTVDGELKTSAQR